MTGLEDNVDGFASTLLLTVGGGGMVVILVGIIAAVVQDRRRAAARRAARPVRVERECHITGCTHKSLTLVRRADTRQLEPVCHGHLDEGFARGWWA